MAEEPIELGDDEQNLIDDLRCISGISEQVADGIVNSLRAEPGMIGPKRFREILEASVGDSRTVLAVWRLIVSLSSDHTEQAIEFLRKWREAAEGNSQAFSEQEVDLVAKVLPRLLQPFPGIERFRKASALATFIGRNAIECDVICDFRPVFDDARDRIEGLVPITTLRIEYNTQAEEKGVMEVTLSSEMLQELAYQIDKAQSKLQRMVEYATRVDPHGFLDLE